jgi:hypothetical protein
VREFKYSFADDSFSAKNLSILNPLQDDEIIEMVSKTSEGIRENPQTKVCFRERLWLKDSRVPLMYPKEMVFLPS